MTLPEIDHVSFLVEHAHSFFAGERLTKARQLEHARRPVGVNVFFFLWAKRVTLLHIKRIKTFGYKTCNREGIRKNFKILQKHNIAFEALVILIEKTTQVALWMTEKLL